MCIIMIKPKMVKYPSVECVNTMCENNPDGFALVWHTGKGNVQILRTMSKDIVLKIYKRITSTYSWRTTSLFLHARIATHGSTNIKNCHGWHSKQTHQTFAHNGILSVANRDDMTDSETFFRDIFEPSFKIGGWEAGKRAINACIGTSKFVFMDDEGDINYFGKYIEDAGCLFSNDTYHEERIPRWVSKYSDYDYGYGSRYWDFVDGEWKSEKKKKTK